MFSCSENNNMEPKEYQPPYLDMIDMQNLYIFNVYNLTCWEIHTYHKVIIIICAIKVFIVSSNFLPPSLHIITSFCDKIISYSIYFLCKFLNTQYSTVEYRL